MKSRFAPVYYAPQSSAIPNHFVRGCVAAGLLSALQNSHAPRGVCADQKKILRQALQGGAAVAAGVAVADALQQRRYGSALASMAVGVAGIALLEKLIQPTSTVSEVAQNGQEKEV